jgi:LDH2 family malate/lactate/ureidoglycolate dehydrogenase
MPLEQFTQLVENFCAPVKATPPANGFSEVLLPGDPERRTRAQRLVEGISLPEQTWREIQALAHELNVPA